MGSGISLDRGNQPIGIVGGKTQLRSREIESTQSQSSKTRCFSGAPSEPHVGVRIGDSRYDGPPLQIDHLGLGLAAPRYLRVTAHCIDPRAGQRQSLRPLRLIIAGINVAMNQDGVTGEHSGRRKKRSDYRS